MRLTPRAMALLDVLWILVLVARVVSWIFATHAVLSVLHGVRQDAPVMIAWLLVVLLLERVVVPVWSRWTADL